MSSVQTKKLEAILGDLTESAELKKINLNESYLQFLESMVISLWITNTLYFRKKYITNCSKLSKGELLWWKKYFL